MYILNWSELQMHMEPQNHWVVEENGLPQFIQFSGSMLVCGGVHEMGCSGWRSISSFLLQADPESPDHAGRLGVVDLRGQWGGILLPVPIKCLGLEPKNTHKQEKLQGHGVGENAHICNNCAKYLDRSANGANNLSCHSPGCMQLGST